MRSCDGFGPKSNGRSEDPGKVTAGGQYHEWLTYAFVEREPAKATVALKWEELQVPFTIAVDDVPARWVAKMRDELRGYAGVGDAKKALEEARLALKQAPDEPNKKVLSEAIAKLEKGDSKIN
jgi:hypothetical protein